MESLKVGSIGLKTGGSIQSVRSNVNMGLEMSGGLFGSGRNVDAVPSVIVVVAQDNFLLRNVKNGRRSDWYVRI
jgi:hypothetical protein